MNRSLRLTAAVTFPGSSPRRRHKKAAGPAGSRARRGVAVLLVLGMLAMTLALSYASLRGQATVAQLAQNLGRGEEARLAAESGLYVALRKMSDGTWAGADTTLTSHISDNSWYEVSYVTGDAQLSPADANYGEYPYRVTITSSGFSSDPGQPSVRAVHKVDAVVQLARRTILPEPAIWSALNDFTLYQWGNREITVQEPVRINGQTTLLGHLLLSQLYPLTTEARDEYLSGLNAMRLAGRGDYRPFASPLTIALLRQDADTITMLGTKLGLTTVDSLAATTPPTNHPGTVMGYRLYPGGKLYTPPILEDKYGATLQNLTLAPDAQTNPLGVFRNRSPLSIGNNVVIRGMLVGEGTVSDIQVTGMGVKFEGLNLAPLEGSSQVYQLPVTLLRDDLRFHATSDATVKGLAMCYDEFELKQGAATAKFSLTGKLITGGLRLRGRDSWIMNSTAWDQDYDDFRGSGGVLAAVLQATFNTIRNTLGLAANDPIYFPEYEQQSRGFAVAPLLTFQPQSGGVKYHWHDWTKPVFQKDPSDAGLRWNLVRWVEGS